MLSEISSFENYAKFMEHKVVGKEPSILVPIVFLGLSEETEEALEKIELRDAPGLDAEIGDMHWYLNAMRAILGFSFEELLPVAVVNCASDENDVQEKTLSSMLRILRLAARIAGPGKKIIRDDNYQPTEGRREKIKTWMRNIYAELAVIGLMNGKTQTHYLENNISKLQGRFERGTLRGDGDNR